LRPQFSVETSAHVTAKACQVCSMWISSGVARDLNDLRRVHQLLVSSLQKLTTAVGSSHSLVESATVSSGDSLSPSVRTTSTSDGLIYSELSLTVEKLAVLRAWAEVYIVAQKKSALEQKDRSNSISGRIDRNERLPLRSDPTFKPNSGNESLLSLVKPELAILSHHWSIALKDYAFLCLPNEYSSQLPIEGGAFYHADLVESSKPIYKKHFTKILLAYSIWLNEIQFNIEQHEKSPDVNESESDKEKRAEGQKEKLFFMLLGLSLETLSNTTGLAQLSDETIENILESIDFLLRTSVGRDILMKKNVYLCVEILSILYK
jgi:hypothetical protein